MRSDLPDGYFRQQRMSFIFLECEGNYRIDFAERDRPLIPLLLLLASFIDVQDYAYRGAATDTYVSGDKWKELAEWIPE